MKPNPYRASPIRPSLQYAFLAVFVVPLVVVVVPMLVIGAMQGGLVRLVQPIVLIAAVVAVVRASRRTISVDRARGVLTLRSGRASEDFPLADLQEVVVETGANGLVRLSLVYAAGPRPLTHAFFHDRRHHELVAAQLREALRG